MSSRGRGSSGAAQTSSALIKLYVNAGQATPSPPIGPALGQVGIKAIDFCKQFNEQTKNFLPGTPLPVKIYTKSDRTFNFMVKVPTTFHLLKIACQIEKGNSAGESVARVPASVIYEVAKIKARDPTFSLAPLKSVFRSVLATARQIGIEVVP
jgi:large subunit ribosomal protein L11